MSGSWVYATHPDTGGETRFPDDPAVIEAMAARGWVIGGELPPHLDPDARDVAPPAAEDPPAADEPAGEPADESPTPSVKSTTSSKTKRTPAGSAGDDTNGAASA